MVGVKMSSHSKCDWLLHDSCILSNVSMFRPHCVRRGCRYWLSTLSVGGQKRELCECDGWVCDLDVTGAPSIFSVIHSPAALTRMLSIFDLSCEENTVHLKWNWSLVDYTRWTPETTKKRSVSRWCCKNRRKTNSLCNLPDVLAIEGIKTTEDGVFLL